MSTSVDTDLVGNPLDAGEAEIVEVYRRLRALVDGGDLAPCAAANLRHALAFTAVAVGDLGLDFEHLLDSGV